MTDELKQLMQSALASYEAAGVDGSEGARAMRESLARIEALEAALMVADELARATERLGIRQLVAGWNGEAYERPYAPHPDDLGATLQTNCGTLYRIDTALTAYRKAIGAEQ